MPEDRAALDSVLHGQDAERDAAALVLGCLRASLRPARCPDDLVRLVESGIDWDRGLMALGGQGILGFFDLLCAGGPLGASIPGDVRTRLGVDRRRHAVSDMLNEVALRRILAACEDEGLRVIVLKGLFLSKVVYPSEGIRPSGDVDLLVPAEDSRRFVSLLGALGFREGNRPIGHSIGRTSVCRSFGSTAEPVVHLDVHTRYLSETRFRARSVGSRFETDVWSAALEDDWAGARSCVMRPEHLLIYLCLHATIRHAFARGLWLADIREALISYEGEWDPAVLCEAARSWHVATFVYLGLLASQQLAGADVPGSVLDELRPSYDSVVRVDEKLRGGEAFDAVNELPVPEVEADIALMRDDALSRAWASTTGPFHRGRRAFRRWRPWMRMKTRLVDRRSDAVGHGAPTSGDGQSGSAAREARV